MKTDKANNTLGLHVNQHDVTYQTMHRALARALARALVERAA